MPADDAFVYADSTAKVFSAPDTFYQFDRDSRTFTGGNNRFMGDGDEGMCAITAHFDAMGDFKDGTVLVHGAFEGIGGHRHYAALLFGHIFSVQPLMGDGVFNVNFLFTMDYAHPDLEYLSSVGVWNSIFVIPGRTASFFLRRLFRTDWGPASIPMNSYIGQVKELY